MATSVPVPMAMPTSAAARAGASLTPSPAMATTRPSACRAGDDVALVVGQHLGLDPVDAQAAGDGLGGDPVVAGEHDDLDAVRAQGGQRRGGGVLDRVGDGEEPGEACRRRRRRRRWRRRRAGGRASASSAAASTSLRRSGSRRCRAATRRPSTVPATPCPAGASKSLTGGQRRARASVGGGDDGRGQRVLRGSFNGGGEAQHLGLVEAGGGHDAGHGRACPRSGCRSCPRRGCRPSPAAPAPRRS